MLVLLFTFCSAGIPIILILVIQGSVWMNFSFPFIESKPMFFLSYLVVSSIQMGANIDYAIVITNRFTQLKDVMPPKQAVIKAISLAFPTILTSGTILAAAGFIIALMSSDAAISSIGLSLGRGTLISIILVMGILPQLLMLGNTIIEKTSFKVAIPVKNFKNSGKTAVDGRIHGYINGRVEGTFHGTVDGSVDVNVVGGNLKDDSSQGESDDTSDTKTENKEEDSNEKA